MLDGVVKRFAKLFAASTDQRVDTYYMLEGLLRAGIDLPRAINTAASAAEGRNDSSTVTMMGHWQDGLANARFSEEISYWVPASEAVIFQGYGVGRIAVAELFHGAGRIAEMKGKLVSEVMKATATPVMLVGAIIVMMWMAGGYMLPALAAISDESRWSLTTVVVSDVALWVHANPLILGAILLAILAFLWLVTIAWHGPGRVFLDRFPPFSIYKLITGVSFLIVVLEFVRVGQDLSSRLFLRLEESSAPYVRSRIRAVRENMSKGVRFGAAMKMSGQNFPDPGLIAVAESLDSTPNWHVELGNFMERWIDRSERTLRTRLGLLRNLMLLLVTVMMGALVSAMFDVMAQVR